MSERPIRVVFVSNTYDPEPGVVHGLPLARWLQRHGYEVTVLTAVPWYPLGRFYPGYKLRPWQQEYVDGVRIVRVPIFPSHDSSASRRILTYTSFLAFGALFGIPQIGKVDVVRYFDNTPTTGTLAWMLSRLKDAPMSQHIADIWPESVLESGMLTGQKRAIAEHLLRRWLLFLYRRNAKTTVLSPGFRRLLIERGAPDASVEVIYNWADEDRFFPVSPKLDLKHALGMDGKFNFLYAGNLGPLQSLDTAIRAMALLRGHSTAQLIIVGSGPQDAHLRGLAESLHLDNVRFVGRRPLDEMNDINAVADVLLVSLGRAEFLRATIPSKTQVSLASARPILLAVAGDAADLVNEARAGIAVEPENPQALADAMRTFAATSKDELEAYGRRGRAFYQSRLSFNIGAVLHDALFRDMVAKQSARRTHAPGYPVTPKSPTDGAPHIDDVSSRH